MTPHDRDSWNVHWHKRWQYFYLIKIVDVSNYFERELIIKQMMSLKDNIAIMKYIFLNTFQF